MADAEQEAPDVPVEPVGQRSEWSFEWWGLLPLLAIVIVAIVGWRALGGGDGDGDGDGTVADAPTSTVERSSVPTTTVVSTTSVATTVPATTTTTSPTEPTVNITGEMKPCRFGDNCLVASFTIDGFDDPPETFTCIYPNSRRDFTLRDGGKDDACITADEGDTITIEVGGVASKTISEANLEGE